MKLEQIKKRMLEYRDFYGGDLIVTDKINEARTKEELNEILHQHENLLEDSLIDALNHLKKFKREVGF